MNIIHRRAALKLGSSVSVNHISIAGGASDISALEAGVERSSADARRLCPRHQRC